MHVVERLIRKYSPRQRSPNHASQQLSYICRVRSASERHQHFGSRTIPTGRKAHLKDHDLNARRILNTSGFNSAKIMAADLKISYLIKIMCNLAVVKLSP